MLLEIFAIALYNIFTICNYLNLFTIRKRIPKL